MAKSPSSPGSVPGPFAAPPDWLAWIQAGLSVLLAVLFLVLLTRGRQQANQILELQERTQGLENSRALERTTGLEQQLRSTVERLQAVERSAARIDVISAENAALRSELRQLRRSQQPKLPPLAPLDDSMSPGNSSGGESNSSSPGDRSMFRPSLQPNPRTP
jgi:hypothetical protein